MKNNKTPQQYPNELFSPLSRSDTKKIKGIKYHHIFKSSKGKSHIYERYMEDQDIAALRIDGPSDSSLVLDHLGNVKLLTGEKTTERGPGSGKLLVKTWGQQQLHNDRSDVQYNAGNDEEGIALSVLSYGDTLEENRGSERFIRASKIILNSDTELVLKANHIIMQAGDSGKGQIDMNAGMINTKCVSSVEKISGQKLVEGFSEFTVLSKNSNSVYNLLLSGHYHSKISGNYYSAIKGWCRQIILGKSKIPTSYPYKVKVLTGSANIEAIKGNVVIDGKRGITLKSFRGIILDANRSVIIKGSHISTEATRTYYVKSSGRMNLSSNNSINIRSSRHIGINAGLSESNTYEFGKFNIKSAGNMECRIKF